MKRKIKINNLLFASSILVAIPTTSVIIENSDLQIKQTSNSDKIDSKQNYIYNFDNKIYNSLEEATDDYCNTHKAINSDLYIGDVNNAIFDQNYKLLDIDQLKKFDRNRLFPAYKNALGQYEHDYNKAKKSFINPGLIQYKYDDLNGKLFNSRQEALESILSTNYKTPVTYYEIPDSTGNIRKINPLNQEDINYFKEQLINDIVYNRNKNNTALKIYDVSSFDKSTNDAVYSPADQKFYFNDNNSQNEESNFNKLKKKIFESYTQGLEKLIESTKWEIYAHLVSTGTTRYRLIEHGNCWVDRDKEIELKIFPYTLDFRNVGYNDISTITDLLISRDTLLKRKEVKEELVKGWVNAALCRIAINMRIKMYGKDFSIKYQYGGDGYTWDVDTDILRPGSNSRSGSVYFDFVLWLQNPDLFVQSLNEYANNFKNNFLKTELSDVDLNSFSYKIISALLDDFLVEAKNIIRNTNFWNSVYLNHINKVEDQNNWVRGKNNTKKDFCNNTKFHLLDDKNKNLLGKLSVNFNDEKNIYDVNSLINNKKHNIDPKQLKFMIEYNNHPVFEIVNNNELLESLYKAMSNPKISIQEIIDNYLKPKITNQNIKQQFLSKQVKNVSSIYDNLNKTIAKVNLNKNAYDCKYTNKTIAKNIDNTLTYNFENSDIKKSNIPNITMKANDYKIDIAIDAYNKNIQHYKLNESADKDFIVNPNDVLVLYEKNATQKQLMYSEFLSNKTNFNPSLFDSKINLYNNYVRIESAKAMMNKLQPAKVVVLYDLLGNVVNPGVKLNRDEELLTTSDAIYDSESTLLQNVYRTKIVRPDETKIFYKEDDGSYTLLKNTCDLIYNVTFYNESNKKYYFQTFKDAWNYVYNYIQLNSIKIKN